MEEKILEKTEDYKDWDKLSQHCEVIEGLTEVEKEKAKRAFLFLKQELGEDFLDNAFNVGHPIMHHIFNVVPWTRRWFTWFAEALKELKDHENYKSLLVRLKDKDKYAEALSILGPSYKFAQIGFKIDFDPKISRQKNPDFKITNSETGEELFVEVSIQRISRIQREADKTMKKIYFETFWQYAPFLHWSGRVHKTLSEKHAEEISKKIKQLIEKVKTENTFQELIIEDVIEVGLASESDKRMLEKWAAERGLKVGEFSGPPFNVDEILRTKRKIEREQKQLPPDHPNIVIIENNNLFFLTRDHRKAITEIEEEVYRYSHLLAVVIAGGYMGSGESIITMKDQHAFIQKPRADIINLLIDQFIILFNRYCSFNISPSTITKIYRAFIRY